MFFVILGFILSINIFASQNQILLDNHKSFYIIDGDSINLKMRIYGIDTPEMGQKCNKEKSKQYHDCGLIAKNQLQKLLNNTNGKIKLNIVGVDDYNRFLVNIVKGNIDIAKTMVRQGMAYSYGDKYKTDQDYAKENNLGFWSYAKPPINPKKWRKIYYK